MNANGRILVPVDFSENSANGLKYAVSLAQKTQAKIIVLHVMQKDEADSFLDLLAMMEGVPMAHSRAAIPVDRLLQEKALDLYNFVEKTVRNPGPLKIIRKIAMGNTADKIPAHCRGRECRSRSACRPEAIFFPVSDGARKVTERDLGHALSRTADAIAR